mgnify:CR=1 FL=1
MKKRIIGIIVLIVVILSLFCFYVYKPPASTKTFEGQLSELKHTCIVPTLDTPLEEGMNTIWCSSFQAAWKTLEQDVAKGDVVLEGSPEMAALLNKAADPRPDVPEGCLYSAAGWVKDGITEKIVFDLKQFFPMKKSPDFGLVDANSIVAYSYIEANVKFALPYYQNRWPLVFTDSKGKKTYIKSFGIKKHRNYTLRRQPRILFQGENIKDVPFEFAVDLCAKSSPSQIIIACIHKEKTLSDVLESIAEKESKNNEELKEFYGNDEDVSKISGISENDILLVPDLFWKIDHSFLELCGRNFLNDELSGMHIDVAKQDILFHLDRNGAELKSEAIIYSLGDTIHNYNYMVDRPFLICMKKRGASMPYFVMWVDNAELLSSW